jgi:PST family polysaccharide transporter
MVVSAGTMTVLALLGFGPAALAWGQLAAQLVTMIAQYTVARVRPRFGFEPRIARESVAFCLPLAFANLVSWLLLSVDTIIVARTLGPMELGLYVLAFNISSWPMNAIGQSIRVVALPVFSHLASPDQRNRALVGVSGVVWSVSLLLGVLLGTLAVPAIGLLYGSEWLGAATALAGLAAFGAIRIVFDLLATFLIATGSSRAVLAVQIIWLAALIPGMYIGVHQFGLLGAGLAHLTVGLVVVLPAYLICLRLVGVDCLRFLRQWVFPTGCIIPAAACCWWVGTTIGNPFLALSAGGIACLLLYVLPLRAWAIRKIKNLKQFETHDNSTLTTSTQQGSRP